MARIKYINVRFTHKNREKLDRINAIIDHYAGLGYKMTLRQLYYRLVSKNVIANNVNEYSKLGTLLTKGRLGGLVDWDAIEDRVRVPDMVYHNNDVEHAIDDAVAHFRLDRMRDQNVHIELWVEKDAISNIMSRITRKYGIRLMVNRGYSSTTAMHDAYNRFRISNKLGKACKILYLGDHDPSGLDMVEHDIPNRLEETFGTMVDVEHLAITMPQIETYDPPPNPAKISDPRAGAYIEEHGDSSWEVDALEPEVLNELVTSSIESSIDMDLWNKIVELEEEMRSDLQRLPNVRNKYRKVEKLIKATKAKKGDPQLIRSLRKIVNA